MKAFIFLALLISSFVHSETLTTKVVGTIASEGASRPELFLLENGRVLRLDEKNADLREGLHEARKENKLLALELDSVGRLRGVSSQLAPEAQRPESQTEAEAYVPTRLASYAEAQDVFRNLNRRYQRNSQCYNRAHIWSFEEWRRIGLRTQKLFMFFTKRYIWDYNYKWWFHVTPITYVGNTPYTLDRAFNRSPLTIKDWTLGFIYSRRDCPLIQRYSQYARNQESEHCYLLPASMYFWQPRDLETFETSGRFKTDFIPSEVNHSYWEAF